MSRRAMEGTRWTVLARMAIDVCQQAERECPRTGPGRKPEIPDWVMAVLIMAALAKRKKTKAAQYRFLEEHRETLMSLLPNQRFPSRSTYYERYRRAWRLYQVAIRLQGANAVKHGWAAAGTVAVDKSLITARGPVWHRHRRRSRGADAEAGWGRSEHDGWVFGYSYEVVVSCGKTGVLWPLLASADSASRSECRSFSEKIPLLPPTTRYVLADRGYDADAHCEAIEWKTTRRRTGRRFVCPTIERYNARRPRQQAWKRSVDRQVRHAHRTQRKAFLRTSVGKSLYRHRGMTVEPFNSWFKTLLELEDRVWHRGLDNNRTQLLAGILLYQLLLRMNRACGRHNGQVKWIIDAL